MFNDERFNVEKFGEFFPHMENILHFGTYYTDVQNNTVKWSPGLYRILGIEPGSIVSEVGNFHDFVHPDDVELVKQAREDSILHQKPYHIEFTIINAEGEHKRVFAENYLCFDDEGKLLGYNGLLKDITEKYENQRMLETKIAQLDKSNHNLQEFVYVASHDLQEPLRKISTFSERLNTKYGNSLDDEGNHYVNRIAASCKSMQTLLEDLLDFSRLSFVDKMFEKVCVEEIINSVLNDLEMKMEESEAQVICNNLPMIDAYPSQLRQLFTNLIHNSIKFRKKDSSVLVKIDCADVFHVDYPHIPLKKDSVYVKIVIEDNGIGFDQEFSEKIFMIFQRLHGKVEYSGSGIGLSICKKIVENHNGFIFAEGILNHGAKFTILLPQNQA